MQRSVDHDGNELDFELSNHEDGWWLWSVGQGGLKRVKQRIRNLFALLPSVIFLNPATVRQPDSAWVFIGPPINHTTAIFCQP